MKSSLQQKIILVFTLVMGALHPKPVQHNSGFQIGATYNYASLKIHDQPLFQGSLGGLQASYEYRPWNRFYGSIKLDWKQGSCQARDVVYVDSQERVGYTFASTTPSYFATLFSGLGYRYLGQKFHSLKFDYNEFYLPVGLLSQFFFQRWWSIGFNLTWMPQVYPTVKISPLKGARWILEKTIGNLSLEFPFTFFLNRKQQYAIVLKPFYEYWEDGKTTAKMSNGTPLGLPGNVYNFWGTELSFLYSF